MTVDVSFEENTTELDTQFEENTMNNDTEFDSVIKIGFENEKDPTVPDWAKQPEKPTYHNSEIEGRVGENVGGIVQTPYDVDQTSLEYTWLEPIEALEGAEILNCYGGDADGMGIPDVDRNIAIGFMSQASGFRTQAIGNYSKASGWWTKAEGQCANAEGLLSRAIGHFTHAEGTRTQATINNAHSEGDMTQATGRQSHAEGQSTVASGFCAHSEGSQTQATNYYAHAEGLGTIAAGRNQTAMGKYNIKDTSSLLIIGNGTKDTARSNAYKLDANGNAWHAGTVECTGIIMKSPNGKRFKLTVDDSGALIITAL